jgi:Asp-tRNA(Asn)/Glu-tRNA(Gln) amidotransferase A subunit family amidase
VVTQDFAGTAEAESVAALQTAVAAAERRGAVVRTVTLPTPLADAFLAHRPLQDFEARQALSWEFDRHRDLLPPLLRQLLEDAQSLTAKDYDAARRTAHRARGVLAEVFAECDALLTFSAPGAAPHGLGSTGDARFNRLWTLMGNPCVNVPGIRTADGLPVGVQVVAAFGRDEIALAAAYLIEQGIRTFP